MKSQSNYVPPPYVPLEQSDAEAEIVPLEQSDAEAEIVPLEQLDAEAEIVPLEQLDAEIVPRNEDVPTHGDIRNGSTQWSSDICDCFDDMDSYGSGFGGAVQWAVGVGKSNLVVQRWLAIGA
ncbi:hypothetical protein FCV25MIE_15203 [Fagus crenata]